MAVHHFDCRLLGFMFVILTGGVQANCDEKNQTSLTAVEGHSVNLKCSTTLEKPVDWRYQKLNVNNSHNGLGNIGRVVANPYVVIGGNVVEEFQARHSLSAARLATELLSNYTLTIVNVSLGDEGCYTCIEDQGGGAKHSFRLTVQPSIPVTVNQPVKDKLCARIVERKAISQQIDDALNKVVWFVLLMLLVICIIGRRAPDYIHNIQKICSPATYSGVAVHDNDKRGAFCCFGEAVALCGLGVTTILLLTKICTVAYQIYSSYHEAGADFPNFVSRQEWGAEEHFYPMPALITPVKYVIIGHTMQDTEPLNCRQNVRSLQLHYQTYVCYSDIGFNYLIGNDGRVYEGIGAKFSGRFARGWNEKTIGIAFIGNYGKTTSLPDNVEKLAMDFLEYLLQKEVLTSDYELYAMRQVRPFPDEPGDAVYGQMLKWPHWTEYRGPIEKLGVNDLDGQNQTHRPKDEL